MAGIDCMVNNIQQLISNAMSCVCPHEHDTEIKRLSTRVHHKVLVDPLTFNRKKYQYLIMINSFFLFLFCFFKLCS